MPVDRGLARVCVGLHGHWQGSHLGLGGKWVDILGRVQMGNVRFRPALRHLDHALAQVRIDHADAPGAPP